jgi:hypothetical protein
MGRSISVLVLPTAGIGLGIADQAGLVDFLVGQADVRDASQFFCLERIARLASLAAILRRVLLISEPAL